MPRLLHVGCGPLDKSHTTRGFAGPEWQEIRLDIDPGAKPDIVASMLDMSAVPSGSVDAVYSSHNIEHLYPFEVPVALGEFARVLRPDGFLIVTCPDLQSVAALVAEGKLLEPAYTSSSGDISPIDILYGHRPALSAGNLFMAHRCGFTDKVLGGQLRSAGFPNAIVRRRVNFLDLWAAATPTVCSHARLRELARQHFPPEGPGGGGAST